MKQYKFKVGDKAFKPKGYKFPCTIVSIFETTSGEIRMVGEMDDNGMLHIFNENQLELNICNIDKQYQELLQDILDNGIEKSDRTGTGTLSVFGRTIRHKMSEGFPLLTTKKMHFKGIVTELLWFLRGETNIKYLVDNNCNIWNGDAYKAYLTAYNNGDPKATKYAVHNLVDRLGDQKPEDSRPFTIEEFVEYIKDDYLCPDLYKEWGELGAIYGKQWRNWTAIDDSEMRMTTFGIDQITNLVNDLKNNPDSRRLLVSAWNPAEIHQAVLPPCHIGFQCWTKKLTLEERLEIWEKQPNRDAMDFPIGPLNDEQYHEILDNLGIAKRSISLMWSQRSCDTMLGIPYNTASYALLLCILGEIANMVPDELIGNLGDTHLYLNHLEQAKEQISRTPYKLPILKISTEFWNPNKNNEDGCTGMPGSYTDDINGLIKGFEIDDFYLENYKSHPKIIANLSN